VHAGETLPFLAFRYGTTVWTLKEINDLDRLAPLVPGVRLTIPPATAPTASTPVFPRISYSPAPVAQGQTLIIEVQGDGPLALGGLFMGHDLTFVSEGEEYWTLLGVDALTPPGGYPLVLTATHLDSGDLITMQETFTVTKGTFTTYNVVVPPSRQGLLDPGLARAEREKVNAIYAGVTEERLWEGAFGYPLAEDLRITAPFGQRRSYNSGPVASYHTGVDYGADEGWAVYAPMTGTVALAEALQVRGQAVILDHGWGVYTAFWHMSAIHVAPGEAVARGQVVGLVGNTGLSTGPHLHWEMRVRGVPVDPLHWTQRVFP
jgi:murein DD-endopeptidase MepM/ murein hydrolase activator NlpD